MAHTAGSGGPSPRQNGWMAVTPEQWVQALVRHAPGAGPMLDEHLAYYDELLLHLLIADLQRWAIALFEEGDSSQLSALLGVLDQGLREGDEDVRNAVAVSFVENSQPWAPAAEPFIRVWPKGLRAEANRQRQA